MQVSKSFCGKAKRIKINPVLKVCLESRAFSLFQISLRGDLKQSKISSISTNAAGLCVKKPWNPQRIPAALCLKILLVFAKYPSFSLFSDTPPAPSFQSILCKLQPLTRHSVWHLPYYKSGATLCKFATDLFEAAVSCCNFAQGIVRILCRTFPKRVGKTHRIALFLYAAYRWKNAQVTPGTVAIYTGYSRSPAPP